MLFFFYSIQSEILQPLLNKSYEYMNVLTFAFTPILAEIFSEYQKSIEVIPHLGFL